MREGIEHLNALDVGSNPTGGTICRCKSVVWERRDSHTSRLDSGHRRQRQGSALLCEREQATLTKNDNASGKLSAVAQGSPR